MARILITSGPTRQYLDPVRYISNASSGQMGRCLAQAALALEYEVTIVSGPVQIDYPEEAKIIRVVSTEEMLARATQEFAVCDGVIGAAAPCDYRPVVVADHKIKKNGDTLTIQLTETPDVLAALGDNKKPSQWSVGFALETEDGRNRAIAKLQKKHCDLMVLNAASAINSANNSIEIIAPDGSIVDSISDTKETVAAKILACIQERLIQDRVIK